MSSLVWRWEQLRRFPLTWQGVDVMHSSGRAPHVDNPGLGSSSRRNDVQWLDAVAAGRPAPAPCMWRVDRTANRDPDRGCAPVPLRSRRGGRASGRRALRRPGDCGRTACPGPLALPRPYSRRRAHRAAGLLRPVAPSLDPRRDRRAGRLSRSRPSGVPFRSTWNPASMPSLPRRRPAVKSGCAQAPTGRLSTGPLRARRSRWRSGPPG